MRAAILNGSVVERIVLLDALDQYPGAIDGANAGIGDTWDGTSFVKPAAPPTPVPPTVSMAQARIAMSRAGIAESAVDAVIAALPASAAKTEAGIWWRSSETVRRNSSNVATLGPLLGLTSAQIDDLFITAAGLTP
jgi:hypothetical protein